MNIFERKAKNTPDSYYFGEFDDTPLAPFSISIATFGSDYQGEKKHYHAKNQKVYLTLSGKGVLNVNGKQVEMNPEHLIHVEPNEVRYIEKVVEAPLKFIVINSSKINDKVVVA